jgi:hypothetical protein
MPACRTCGVDVEAAFGQIDTARKKLELLQEKVVIDQELIKQDKKNFKRRLQAAKTGVKKSQSEVDRREREIAQTEETAKKNRRDQDWRQIQELREKLKRQELQFRKEKKNLDDRITILQSSTSAREKEQQYESEDNLNKIQDAQSTVRRLETQLLRKNSTLESYEVQIRELGKRNDEAPKDCIKCTSRESQLRRLEETVEQLTDKLRVAEAGSAKEQQERGQAIRKLDSKATELRQMDIEISQLKAEVENLTTKCESYEESLTAIRKEFTSSETENRVLHTQVQELKVRNGELEKEKSTLKATAVPKASGTTNGEKSTNGGASGKMVMEYEWQGNELFGVYTGCLDESENPIGSGTLRADDGAVYDGDWKGGLRHGNGVFATVEGDLYRGEWENDVHHGQGTFVWSDGRIYRGIYVNGERHGQGVMCWPHGAHYQGEFTHDKRNGLGKYTHADGRLYSGEYKDDRPHGRGELKAAGGDVIFEGQWELGEQMS